MKKLIIMLVFLTLSMSIYASGTKSSGTINKVNYVNLDIKIDGVAYKLSNTVKVYGFNGDKYLNVKKLTSSMDINYQYSTRKGVNTISNIWVQAD